MKTAIELLKFVAFMLAIAWLCSCNSNQQTIKLIHAYHDSIGINKIKQRLIIMQADSLKHAHGMNYPPGIGNLLMAKIKLESQQAMYELTIDSLKIELER